MDDAHIAVLGNKADLLNGDHEVCIISMQVRIISSLHRGIRICNTIIH